MPVASAAVEESGFAFARGAEATIHLVGDAEIKEINARWRNKDAPTNVLSFPAAPASKIASARLIGDVFVSLQTLQREAEAEDKPLADHFRHLVLHGFLHLLGYDHETPAEQAACHHRQELAATQAEFCAPAAGGCIDIPLSLNSAAALAAVGAGVGLGGTADDADSWHEHGLCSWEARR